MDPRHLHQLAVILEKGTMSRASQYLHLTQPTLSHNMKVLEMQAGGLLFERSRLGVRSTPLGELLAREGRAIARGLKGAQQATTRHKLGFEEHVRIGTGNLIGAALLPLVVAEMARSRSGMSLTLQSEKSHLLVDRLIDGEYDLVISPSWLERPPQGIARSLLVPDRLGMFCGASHPLADSKSVEFGDIDGQAWLSHLGVDSPFARDAAEILAEMGAVQAQTEVTVIAEVMMLMRILSQGRHLAVLPYLPIKVLSQWFPVLELKLGIPPKPRRLYLWFRESLLEDPGLVSVKETIEAVARELAVSVSAAQPPPDQPG